MVIDAILESLTHQKSGVSLVVELACIGWFGLDALNLPIPSNIQLRKFDISYLKYGEGTLAPKTTFAYNLCKIHWF